MNNQYDIRINFPDNNFTCWLSSLNMFLSRIHFENLAVEDILQFASYSSVAIYNLEIIDINHVKKIVELKAIPE